MSEENKEPGSPAKHDQETPFVVRLPDDPQSAADWYLWAGVMALLVLVCFWPSVPGGFLWDDDRYVTHNQALENLDGLQHIWTPPLQTVQYYPLTFTSFWIEHHLWQNSPLGYRVVNLILHAGAAIVLWRILRRLKLPGAWVIATAWAVHPLQTESVAWITERKNVLSGLLAMASVLFYLDWSGIRAQDSAEPIWKLPKPAQIYGLSMLFFILGLFAKSVVGCVPVVLLLVLWWKRKLDSRRALALVPMFVVGAVMGSVTAWIETDPIGLVRAVGPDWPQNFASRILVAGRASWFYVSKLFFPAPLNFNYRRVLPDTGNAAQWLMALGVVGVVAALFILRNRIGRGPVVAALCYLAALFPSLGFVNVYPFRFSYVADHFAYLAIVPLIAGTIALAMHWFHGPPGGKPHAWAFPWPAVLGGMLLALLGAASWIRAGVFVDTATLWQDTLEKNSDSWLAAGNLARDQIRMAKDAFTAAGEAAQSGDLPTADSFGADGLSFLDDAEANLNRAIANPATPADTRVTDYDALVEAMITRTRSPKADVSDELSKAEAILKTAMAQEKLQESEHPDAEPFYTMGLVLKDRADLQRKPTTRPSSEPSAAQAAAVMRSLDTPEVVALLEQARDYFEQSMSISNKEASSPLTHLEGEKIFGLASLQRGNVDFDLGDMANQRGDTKAADAYLADAVNDFNWAIKVEPSNREAHYRIALCLQHFGKFDDAKMHLMRVFTIDPRYAPAYAEMGSLLLLNPKASEADLVMAIQCFRDAASMDPSLTDAQQHLADALKLQAEQKKKAATAPAASRP